MNLTNFHLLLYCGLGVLIITILTCNDIWKAYKNKETFGLPLNHIPIYLLCTVIWPIIVVAITSDKLERINWYKRYIIFDFTEKKQSNKNE